jgi:hypothetical protein
MQVADVVLRVFWNCPHRVAGPMSRLQIAIAGRRPRAFRRARRGAAVHGSVLARSMPNNTLLSC